MFVVKQDFDKLPYNVPAGQLALETSEGVFSETEFSVEFQTFADETEAEILKKLLGLELYDEFIAGLAPESTDYPEEKWERLLDGFKYTIGDIKYEWVGMRKLVTPFIYAMWLRANYDSHTTTGIQVALVENAEKISPALRIVQAWNRGYQMAGSSTKCNDSQTKTFNQKNTLYGFLTLYKETDYPSWHYTDVGYMNRFNL